MERSRRDWSAITGERMRNPTDQDARQEVARRAPGEYADKWVAIYEDSCDKATEAHLNVLSTTQRRGGYFFLLFRAGSFPRAGGICLW
ncbi:MAG: hypothetical protein J2P21_31855 [Chloracidobacterium sp.]|nr:hypothetical protein [Chloracidobacterium sp.]